MYCYTFVFTLHHHLINVLQVQQNIHAVAYHITQYHRIIAELRWKISRLEAKQSRCQCQNLKGQCRPTNYNLKQVLEIISVSLSFVGSMEVDGLCHRLLAFLEEQKDIR